MELQTIFNQVCQHLVRQGKAAIQGGGACRYRTEDGMRCAVGYLISDENYECSLEGKTADEDDVLRAVSYTIGDLSTTDEWVLRHCQYLHDGELLDDGLSTWAQGMIKLAMRYDLIVPKQVRELACG